MRLSSHFRFFLLLLIVVPASISSCKNEREVDGNSETEISTDYKIKYAKGFDIQYFNSYKKLIIKSPYPDSKQDFVYTLRNKKFGDTNEVESIGIPLDKIVATSTTHVPKLEILWAAIDLFLLPNG